MQHMVPIPIPIPISFDQRSARAACVQVFAGVLGQMPVPAGRAPGVTLGPALPAKVALPTAFGVGADAQGAAAQRALRPRLEACGRHLDLDPGMDQLPDVVAFAQAPAHSAVQLFAAAQLVLDEECPTCSAVQPTSRTNHLVASFAALMAWLVRPASAANTAASGGRFRGM